MNYIPLNIKSHYSLLQSVITPKSLNKFGTDFKFGFCDIASISGSVQMTSNFSNCVIGMELEAQDRGDICIISKNYQGWLDLIKICSFVNDENNVNNPINYEQVEPFFSNNLIIVYKYLEPNPFKNHYYGIDITSGNEFIREAIPPEKRIAFNTTMMVTEDQIKDLEVVYCIKDNISIDYCHNKYPKLFKSEYKFHVMSDEEMLKYGYTQEELDNTIKLYNQCEQYQIVKDLVLPKFDCGEQNSAEYLKELCRDGWRKKIANQGLDENKYAERVKYELDIINQYGLSDYFLIVRDILKYVEDKFYLTSIRGSAAGCLVSYLIDLSKIDPVKYNLLFERFISAGRFEKGKVSPPDIDCDVPADNRDEVLEYIRSKYGYDKVGQILTFQTIKGSAAIKGVFRVNKTNLSFAEVNYITKQIPEMSKVADKIKDMPEDERSLIKYALIAYPEKFEQWVTVDENGEIQGEYKQQFEQAIRLEGLKSASSRHAAGVIVSPKPLIEVCPTKYDNEADLYICSMEMNDLESLGCLKLDILGLRLFSKIVDTVNDLKVEYV